MSNRSKPTVSKRRGKVSVEVLLQWAIKAHQTRDLVTAHQLYKLILQRNPIHPDALHFLGVLSHQRGCSDDGIRYILLALAYAPQYTDAHNNLGNIYKECGRYAEAENCYRQALECDKTHYNALNNLALVLQVQERPDEAMQTYRQLLTLAPNYTFTHYHMGLFLREYPQNMQDIEQSAEHFSQAWFLDNENVHALQALGETLYLLGRKDEAVDVYRRWCAQQPDNPVPQHLLAACGGATTPIRANDDYICKVFDSFASSFDEQLLNNLDYRAPQVLSETLHKMLPEPQRNLDVLDAGCGTGLCAPLVREYARSLVGVDLSVGMIGKAQAHGMYDQLVTAELTVFLQQHPLEYDLIISADTLVYFGDLHEVLTHAGQALRTGGVIGFTVEVLENEMEESVLGPSGRYQHNQSYLSRILAECGFSDIQIHADALRKEAGKLVMGWIVVARREMLI